jgi:hypothetical protein
MEDLHKKKLSLYNTNTNIETLTMDDLIIPNICLLMVLMEAMNGSFVYDKDNKDPGYIMLLNLIVSMNVFALSMRYAIGLNHDF